MTTAHKRRNPRTALEFRTSISRRASRWSAIADRLEIVIDCLTNLGVADTVHLNREVAARAVTYCRQRAAGAKFSEFQTATREGEMFAFLAPHNQCLDWVLVGDPTCMIARLGQDTSSRTLPPRLQVVE